MLVAALTVWMTLAPGPGAPAPLIAMADGPDTAKTAAAKPAKDGADPARSGGAKDGGKKAGGKKKKVIRLEAVTVEGRIQKPQAFYILQRSSLNFDELNKTESFVPKVVHSVEKDPF